MEAGTKLKIRIRSNIGDLLRAEGRSQTWLAEKIETTPQMVNDWCNGKGNPSIGYILRIIRITGWSIEQMFEEE